MAREDTESGIDAEAVAELIRQGVAEAEVSVRPQRGPEDDHYVATVVSPAFEGEPLVQQHELVYDALGEHMTTDIHALELKTYTPAEYAEHGED